METKSFWNLEYKTLKEEGEYILYLDFRSWAKSNGIVCNFTEDGTMEAEKVKLFCWKHGNIYNPKQSNIAMSHIEDNTFWNIEVKNNKKEMLNGSKQNAANEISQSFVNIRNLQLSTSF